MATYRINKPLAAAYALAAALVTGGGGYYYNANIDEWRYEAAQEAAMTRISGELAKQLPLTREMTALVPNAAYPVAPETCLITMPLCLETSMFSAFNEAERFINRTEELYGPHRACAILNYLRGAHRAAVRAYTPADGATPALTVPLAQHRALAEAHTPKCEV